MLIAFIKKEFLHEIRYTELLQSDVPYYILYTIYYTIYDTTNL